MRAKLTPFLFGLLGAAVAYGLSLPAYHHAFGLVRADCVPCLSAVYQNTRMLLEQAKAEQAPPKPPAVEAEHAEE